MSLRAMARVFNPSLLLLRAALRPAVRIASPKRFRPDSYIPALTRSMAYSFCEKGLANTNDYRVFVRKCWLVLMFSPVRPLPVCPKASVSGLNRALVSTYGPWAMLMTVSSVVGSVWVMYGSGVNGKFHVTCLPLMLTVTRFTHMSLFFVIMQSTLNSMFLWEIWSRNDYGMLLSVGHPSVASPCPWGAQGEVFRMLLTYCFFTVFNWNLAPIFARSCVVLTKMCCAWLLMT